MHFIVQVVNQKKNFDSTKVSALNHRKAILIELEMMITNDCKASKIVKMIPLGADAFYSFEDLEG